MVIELTPEFVHRFNEQVVELQKLQQAQNGQEQTEVAELKKQNDTLKTELAKLQAALAKLRQTKKQKSDDRSEFDALIEQVRLLEEDRQAKQSTLVQVREELTQKDSAILKLRHDLDTRTDEIQTLEDDNKRLVGQLAQPGAGPRVQEPSSEVEKLTKQLDDIAEYNAVLSLKIKLLERRSP
ncbi:MAG: hypothetical protein ABGZ35_00950 [Planctomycetaceae bacterium]